MVFGQLVNMASPCFDLKELFKTPLILTPSAVGCELQFVLHFHRIQGIRGIRGGVQESCFGGPLLQPRIGEI